MKATSILSGMLFTTSLVCAQEAPDIAGSAPSQVDSKANQEYVTPLERSALASISPMLAYVKADAKAGTSTDDFCSLGGKKRLPAGARIVPTRLVTCTSRYGTTFAHKYLEFLYRGDAFIAAPEDVALLTGSLEDIERWSQEQRDASQKRWRLRSLELSLEQMEKALAAVKATAASGVAIVSAGVYDVSEYTEGTGLRVRLHNSGTKTIKYITFTVVGYNSVKDPVRDYRTRATSVTLKGVGPIEPGEGGSYSNDYMWMTDLVEDFDIKSIRLDFMDGTSRTIVDVKRHWLSATSSDMVFGDN